MQVKNINTCKILFIILVYRLKPVFFFFISCPWWGGPEKGRFEFERLDILAPVWERLVRDICPGVDHDKLNRYVSNS